MFSYGQNIDNLKGCFPKKRDHVYIYDQAGVLTAGQKQSLQSRLTTFTDTSTNVLVVLIPTTLCGYDKATYTTEYGDQMGVGREDLDNGIVLMVLPKEISETGRGETDIRIGTGLQGAITDLGTKDIVEFEMIPHFKQRDYYTGISNAVDILTKLASGEISEDEYRQSKNSWVPFLILGVIIVMFIIISRRNDDFEDYDKNGKRTTRRRPFIFMGPGGFSGGGGGFSGGGGGFGGFGGGGFSGGGAGGSW